MKVAGLGFKRDVTLASLREALFAAGGPAGLAAVATVSDKADAEVLKQLARECGVPIKAVSADVLAGVEHPHDLRLLAHLHDVAPVVPGLRRSDERNQKSRRHSSAHQANSHAHSPRYWAAV